MNSPLCKTEATILIKWHVETMQTKVTNKNHKSVRNELLETLCIIVCLLCVIYELSAFLTFYRALREFVYTEQM